MIHSALIGTMFLCTASIALAQTKPETKYDLGAAEYKSSCAACHGVRGKGDGPFGASLTKRPTDLTTLAKRNGGVFPVQRIYEVIDGRRLDPAHGTGDMPIWGTRYLKEAAGYSFDTPSDEEWFIRNRIVWLIDYLNRLQVK
jgi:mono/diheme cytochrome c family protein